MRRYPLPRAAVDLAVSTGHPDPVLAAGYADEVMIADLNRRISRDGPTDETGGEVAQRWVAKMAGQTDPDWCFDCEDTGLYGVVDTDDHNVVYDVLRSGDFLSFDRWTDEGWVDHVLPDGIDLRILTEESAQHVVESLREGCDGAYLHPGTPVGYLPEDAVLTAATWNEEDHPRDRGKFTKKDQQKTTEKAHARGADMARYIKEGGKRPVGVKPLEKKGKKGKGKKGKDPAKEKAKAEREKIKDQEAAEREAKAEADLAAEQAKQDRADEAEAAKAAIADEYQKRIDAGEDIAEVEKWARETSAAQAKEVAAKEKDVAASEKVRKLEYARRMASLRTARQAIKGAGEPASDWVVYAVVDAMDPNAVMALIRMHNTESGLELQSWQNGDWAPDPKILAQLRGVEPPPLVELSEEQIELLLKQMSTEEAPQAKTAAMSPDPNAAKLRAYWVSGKGRLKIKWGAPGDFTRCVRHLRKYIPARVEGYCANLHKLATGMWPGDRGNRGVAGSGPSEDVIWDAVLIGGWILEQPAEVDMLHDGIYSEAEDALLSAIVAGASFPVAPPDEWFQDPGLKGPTPLTVDESGHVYGHIATFDVPHIGMPGKVHAPRSKSGYAFFKTGQIITASGNKINVGQLTLAGGHAPLSADAAAAVAHYDNTDSAIADLNIGDDRFGIWVAGAVRPEATTEQVRALRAAAPSGDWRPINGRLELVAICQVNVPGFPVARARVASGAVVALVAAGARPLAMQRASLLADAAVLERVGQLESLVLGPDAVKAKSEQAAVDKAVKDAEAEIEENSEKIKEASESVKKMREYIREQRMEKLRKRVYGNRAAKTGGEQKAVESISLDDDTEGD